MPPPRKPASISQANDHFVGRFRAMASPCEILVDTRDQHEAEALVAACAQEVWRVEDKFSRYLPANIIDRINSSAGAGVTVDDETAGLINFAFTLHGLSDGLFDITSGILRKAWDFDGSDRLPTTQRVARLAKNVGMHKVSWQKPQLRIDPGMQIDLGGIGKEYAVDRAAHIVAGLSGLSCLINFGGDLCVTRARSHGKTWHVGVEGLRTEIRLAHGALATSGDANRYLQKDGVRYSHILNPKTGWPIEQAPHSVTVLANTCTQAGMLATLAMLKGEDAESFLESQKIRHWCLR